MKLSRTLLLSVPLLILAGCNSSSNGTHQAKVTKPEANYKFTESALKEIVEDREDYFEGMNLTYGGKYYNRIMYAEAFGDDLLITKMVDDHGNTLDVAVYNDRPYCYLYAPSWSTQHF